MRQVQKFTSINTMIRLAGTASSQGKIRIVTPFTRKRRNRERHCRAQLSVDDAGIDQPLDIKLAKELVVEDFDLVAGGLESPQFIERHTRVRCGPGGLLHMD